MRMTIAAIAACFAMPAMALDCAPHDVMMESLADGWGEGRVSVALDQRGHLLEVYANLTTQTWTAVATTPDGESCIAASGTAYEPVVTPPGIAG